MIMPHTIFTSTIRKFTRKITAHTGGSVAVIFGLVTPLLIGFVGLSVDVIFWYTEQNKLQSATDQAAMSAAYVLQYSQNASDLTSATNKHLAKLFPNDFASINVQVNNPPTTSIYAGNAKAIEVITQKPQPLYFLKIFNMENILVGGRAVSLNSNTTEFCILGLLKSEDKAVEFTGSATVDLGCGIASNSESTDAVYISGSSNVTATGVSTSGDIYQSGSGDITADIPLETLAPTVQDPYGPDGRNLQVPDLPTACTAQNLKIMADTTLAPGRYCGGISFQGGHTTLSPGVYLIDGGDFDSVGGAEITGDGVTIVLTGNGMKYAEVKLAGGTDLTLHAPNNGGPFDGVLFFQDYDAPAYQGANLINNKIVGNSNLDLNGALYFPNQALSFSGGSGGATSCLQLVAAKVTFIGNTSITNNCQTNDGTEKITHPVIKLVE